MRRIGFVLGGLLAPAMLYAWTLLYSQPCYVLLIPAVAVLFLFDYSRVAQQAHRDVIADGYFHSGGLLHGLARTTICIAVFALVSAAVFTFILFTTTANWNALQVQGLMASSVLVIVLYAVFLSAARSWRVKDQFAAILARRWTVWINTLFGVVALGFLAWNSPPPSALAAETLQAALETARPEALCRCPDIGAAVRLQAEFEAVGLWAMNTLSAFVPAGVLNILLWLPYILSGSLAVAAYTRMSLRMMDLFRIGGRTHDG